MHRWTIILGALFIICQWHPSGASAVIRDETNDAQTAFFDKEPIPTIRILLSEEAAAKLRAEPRQYVKAQFTENGKATFANVGIKLKGQAGSFRGLDDRPAITLHMTRYGGKARYHGLTKFHLNNSVQDESYLCEWICARMCLAAKVPTPRSTHARVWLNGRDLGLYVLKEGFDKPFLSQFFTQVDGNLYDGGFLQDIDAPLNKESGNGPSEHRDLQELLAACREADPVKRWQAIQTRLDVDAFISFMAMERLLCHWDGYTMNKNNYRIYFDPKTKKAHFFAHGMDQMFQDVNFPLLSLPPTIVGSAVLQNTAWRKQYRDRIKKLLPLFKPESLNRMVDASLSRMQPVVDSLGKSFADAHALRVRELRERLTARYAHVIAQMKQPDPSPLEFDTKGEATLNEWFAEQTSDTTLEEVTQEGKTLCLIRVGPSGDCVSSWRQRVMLAKGKYRVELKMKAEGVEPRKDAQGEGAGLRISGSQRQNKLIGNQDWQTVTYDFEVLDELREIVFVAELRATKGTLLLESTARLVRLN